MDLKKDLELLNQGILPDSLNFTLTDSGNEIDIQQLQYNAFYKSYEYFENKFPPGHEVIPGFDKVIEYLADNSRSPLDEINERQLKNEIITLGGKIDENKNYTKAELSTLLTNTSEIKNIKNQIFILGGKVDENKNYKKTELKKILTYTIEINELKEKIVSMDNDLNEEEYYTKKELQIILSNQRKELQTRKGKYIHYGGDDDEVLDSNSIIEINEAIEALKFQRIRLNKRPLQTKQGYFMTPKK